MMMVIQQEYELGHVQRNVYELTVKAYKDSRTEMRSQTRDAAAHWLRNMVLRG